jgi:3-deoxy-D-manno-octulosonic acid kinase
LTAALAELGLPVPAPVAARYERQAFAYRADLLTVRIAGAVPLSNHLAEWPLHVWLAVGRTLARFHRHGAWHADLNAHNVLVDESALAADHAREGDGLVHVIDWDRGRLLPQSQRSASSFRGNQARLERSLQKLALPAGWGSRQLSAAWAQVEAGYLEGGGDPRSRLSL